MRPFRPFRKHPVGQRTREHGTRIESRSREFRPRLRKHGGQKSSDGGGDANFLQRLVGNLRQQHESPPKQQSSWEEGHHDSWDSNDGEMETKRVSMPRQLRRKNTIPIPNLLAHSVESEGSLEERDTRSSREYSVDPSGQNEDYEHRDESSREQNLRSERKSHEDLGKIYGRDNQRQQHQDNREDDDEVVSSSDSRRTRRPVRVVERQYFYDTRDEVEGNEISCENWSSVSSVSSVSRRFFQGTEPRTAHKGERNTLESSTSTPHRSPHSESTAIADNKYQQTPTKMIRPSSMRFKNVMRSPQKSSKAQSRVRKLEFDPLSGNVEAVSVHTVGTPEDQIVHYPVSSAAKSTISSKQTKRQLEPIHESKVLTRVAEIEQKELQQQKLIPQPKTALGKKSELSRPVERNVPNVSTTNPLPPDYSPKCEKDAISMYSRASSVSNAKSGASGNSSASISCKSSSSSSSKSMGKEIATRNENIDRIVDEQHIQGREIVERGPTVSNPISFLEVDLSSISSILESMPSMSSLGASGRSSISNWTKQFKRVDDPPGQIGIPLVPMAPNEEPNYYNTAKPYSHDSASDNTGRYSVTSRQSARSLDSTNLVIKPQGSQPMSWSSAEMGIPSIAGASFRSNQERKIEVQDSDSSIGLNSLSSDCCNRTIPSGKSQVSRNPFKSNGSNASRRSTPLFWTKSKTKAVPPVNPQQEADRLLPLVPHNSSVPEDSIVARRDMTSQEDPSQLEEPKPSSPRKSMPHEQSAITDQIKKTFSPVVRKVNSDPEALQARPTLLQQQLSHRFNFSNWPSLETISVNLPSPQKSGSVNPTTNPETDPIVSAEDSPIEQEHDPVTADSVSQRSNGSCMLPSVQEENEVDFSEHQGIELTGQIVSPHIEPLNDEYSATSSMKRPKHEEIPGEAMSAKFSFSDGNSIMDSVKESCSRDTPNEKTGHVDQQSRGDDTGSFADNVSLNNLIPWRAEEEQLHNHRNQPPPLFFDTLSAADDCSTAATKTLESKSSKSESRYRPQNINNNNKGRRSVAFADDVSNNSNTEDSSHSPHSSTVVSQVTMDASFSEFERNFCMDLAANVGSRNNTNDTNYDPHLMHRYQSLVERKKHRQQEVKALHPDTNSTVGQKKIKFMDKPNNRRGGKGKLKDGCDNRTLDNTWSMEGIVESVSKIWS
ncbi:hypothetical protein IV203_017860 [Nitzschia inconspicua]|uniref:Uncharacterized protein n=1 Tax=Nitzschia inconspicua TaxID=303405 RepID=A0A9K3M158_9STRA|nr:hypothetical protein IV203_017860 [Nitzschia inconspicua]